MNTKRIILLFTSITIISFSFRALSQNIGKYEIQAETGVTAGIEESVDGYLFSLSTGRKINSRVALGGGVSCENYGEDHLLLDARNYLYKDTGRRPFWVPFAYGKYTFSHWGNKITPYVKGKIGYGIFFEKKVPEKYYSIPFYHPKDGMNTSLDLGCTYPLAGETRISLAVSYHFQQLKNRYQSLEWDYSQRKDNSSIGLNVGILF
jgi:hypothetical protein